MKLCIWRVIVLDKIYERQTSSHQPEYHKTYERRSMTIDEAKLRKMAVRGFVETEMYSGDEHQYNIDQMRNFLKSELSGKNSVTFPMGDICRVLKVNLHAAMVLNNWENRSMRTIFYNTGLPMVLYQYFIRSSSDMGKDVLWTSKLGMKLSLQKDEKMGDVHGMEDPWIKKRTPEYIDLRVFHMAQQVILAAQLVPRYHTIGRCNNYVMLQSISSSPECKILLPQIHRNKGRIQLMADPLNRSIDSDKYLEGKFMQRPPLFESDHFIYWKNIFETYVKAKDLDLWHIILNGYFPSVAKNEVTQVLEVVPFEENPGDLKKKLAKNNDAKMVLYNALPKKEYERIFMCKTAKDIWQSLLITHQGNSQVKDNKIDLLVQQYEQFTILEEESIDSSFARFNTFITSLKALDEGFSGKNYVRKFLRALHPTWGAKIMANKEYKDLSSLALDELISNLKVHEVVMEKDSEIYKGKKKIVKSIALKSKKESSGDETLTSESDDEQYAMAVRNFKKFFRRKGKFVRQPREEKKSFRQRDEKKGKSNQKCFRCGDPNHLIGNCPKPSRNKD
ncbi:zf-CCHC domain-containing protein [Tanacetum coccineum]